MKIVTRRGLRSGTKSIAPWTVVEIAGAIGRDDHARRSRRRRLLLRRERPAATVPADPVEAAIGERQHAGIDLHVVRLAVLQQIVMRIDRRDVVVNDHRIEVKPVAEPADDRELVVARRRHGRARRRSRNRVGVRRMRARCTRRASVCMARPGPSPRSSGRAGCSGRACRRACCPPRRRCESVRTFPRVGALGNVRTRCVSGLTPVAASAGKRVMPDCAVGRASIRNWAARNRAAQDRRLRGVAVTALTP